MSEKELLERISIDPNVLHGKPRVRGTRIPVSLILDNLAAGHDEAYIKREWPDIQSEDIRAAVLFASRMMQGWEVLERRA